VAATFGRDFRHEQAKPTKPPRPRCRPKRVPDPLTSSRSTNEVTVRWQRCRGLPTQGSSDRWAVSERFWPTGICSRRPSRRRNRLKQVAFHPAFIASLSVGDDALMSTAARLDDLKRDLARLERKRTGSPRQGRTAKGGRGREAEHPGQIL
jgi:hypothetical protein